MLFLKNRITGILCSGLVLFSMQGCVQQTKLVHSNLAELPDPTADTLSDWSGVTTGLHASFASIDVRFPKSIAPVISSVEKQRVKGWKGEKVAAQVLLWTSESLDDIEVHFSQFEQSTGEKLSAEIANASFVRYVMTDEYGSGCGPRKDGAFPASLSADMIDNISSLDLEAKAVRPIWLSVQIPRDALIGTYGSKISVTSKGKVLKSLDFDLEVIGQTLPAPSEWKFHLDQWQHP